MALTIGEANDLNTVLYYLLGKGRPGSGPIDPGKALAAAEHLAGRAYKVLAAGLTPETIREVWRQCELPGGRGQDDDVPSCRMCGCTENAACEGGCAWVPDPLMQGDLCSACLEQAQELVAALVGPTSGWVLPLARALYEVYAATNQEPGDIHRIDQAYQKAELLLVGVTPDQRTILTSDWAGEDTADTPIRGLAAMATSYTGPGPAARISAALTSQDQKDRT